MKTRKERARENPGKENKTAEAHLFFLSRLCNACLYAHSMSFSQSSHYCISCGWRITFCPQRPENSVYHNIHHRTCLCKLGNTSKLLFVSRKRLVAALKARCCTEGFANSLDHVRICVRPCNLECHCAIDCDSSCEWRSERDVSNESDGGCDFLGCGRYQDRNERRAAWRIMQKCCFNCSEDNIRSRCNEKCCPVKDKDNECLEALFFLFRDHMVGAWYARDLLNFARVVGINPFAKNNFWDE